MMRKKITENTLIKNIHDGKRFYQHKHHLYFITFTSFGKESTFKIRHIFNQVLNFKVTCSV